MYGTIQVKINVAEVIKDYLVYQCRQSNNLINSAIYHVKQAHYKDCQEVEFFTGDEFRSGFKLQRVVSAKYADLCSQLKENPHYKALGGQSAQQSLKSVAESFTSYNSILADFFGGEAARPKMPRYRTKGGLAPISYPAQAVKFDVESGQCRLPVSKELGVDVKQLVGVKEIWINGCTGIAINQICEVRILPRNNELYAEYVYKHAKSWGRKIPSPELRGNDGATCHLGLDFNHALAIDPGLNNWLTCVSTRKKSFIVDGRKLKSINQNYNRRIANLKKGKPAKYWDEELARITEKRNRTVRDAINKAARFVVNHCLTNRIGQIVFGWNEGNKDSINIGTKNNQEFVLIPTARLKNRLKQLCEQYGIGFTQTEESYTSKASFLDDDFLPIYGAKLASWKPSGRRIKRGQYKTADGILINADTNGAANILRKVSAQLGILTESVRAVLTLPQRYDLFSSLNKSYRKRCEVAIQSPVATSA